MSSSKKLLATFLVALFVVSAASSAGPTLAHWTLGDYSAFGFGLSTPFNAGADATVPETRAGHVAGDLAYVWPGSGGYSGQGRVWPGYIPPGQQDNYYSPYGAIITGTKGELIFGINVTARRDWLMIYIPPEFTPPVDWAGGDNSNIWTTISNDYAKISVWKADSDNPYAPGWWCIEIATSDGAIMYPLGDTGNPHPEINEPYRGLYYVGAVDMKAPDIAGKYFFKILVHEAGNTGKGMEPIPVQNWPVLLVKADVDPAYITGRIHYGGTYYGWYYGYYYSNPIDFPGMVEAVGTTPEGRKVTARAYFPATARGYFELEGLAPGTYEITVSAQGFTPYKLPYTVTVAKGQSLHLPNIHLKPSPVVRVTIDFKCGAAKVHLDNDTRIIVLITDDPAYPAKGTAVATLTGLESGKPWPFRPAKVVGACNSSISVSKGIIGLYGVDAKTTGHVPQPLATTVSGLEAGKTYYIRAFATGWVQTEDVPFTVPAVEYSGIQDIWMDLRKGSWFNIDIHFHNTETIGAPDAVDSNRYVIVEAYEKDTGKLSAFNYTMVTAGSGTVSLPLKGFGAAGPNGLYSLWRFRGASFLDYGLPTGTYEIKVYVKGYYMLGPVSATVVLCGSPTYLSLHMIKGGKIKFTVDSYDCEDPAQPLNWLYPSSRLRVYIKDAEGKTIGHVRLTQAAATSSVSSSDTPCGVDSHFEGNWAPEVYTESYYGAKYITTFDRDLARLYGRSDPNDGFLWKTAHYGTYVKAGQYTFEAYTVGYVQTKIPSAYVGTQGQTSDIKIKLYKGAKINARVMFKVEEQFAFTPDDIPLYARIEAYDTVTGALKAANISMIPPHTRVYNFTLVGFHDFEVSVDRTGAYSGVLGDYSPRGAEVGFSYVEPRTQKSYYAYGIPEGQYEIKVSFEWFGRGDQFGLPSMYFVQTATVTAAVRKCSTAWVYFDVHKMPYVEGLVLVRNWSGAYRTASWMTVEISGSSTVKTSTKDGSYKIWLPGPGTYTMTIYLFKPAEANVGYVTTTRTISVTWGASSTQDALIQESGIPVPEFPLAGALALISALAASLYLLRGLKRKPLGI